MATVKTGYDNALEFDPTSGIIKYGQFEFFANQVVTPKVTNISFDDYVKSRSQNTLYGPSNQEREAMRQQFAADVESGSFTGYVPKTGVFVDDNLQQNPNPSPAMRSVSRVDENTLSVTSYEIPSDIEFINKLNAQASQLATASAQGQVTDSSRPTPGNARLGKPNYSRAASVLAGEQSPLGGAKTTLGS